MVVEFSGWEDSGTVDEILYLRRGENSSEEEVPKEKFPKDFPYYVLAERGLSFADPEEEGALAIDTQTGEVFAEVTEYKYVYPEEEELEKEEYPSTMERIPVKNWKRKTNLTTMGREVVAKEIKGL